jgi:hypothetical protein
MNKFGHFLIGLAIAAAIMYPTIHVHAQQPVDNHYLAGAAIYADPCLTNTPSYGTFSGTANTKLISGTSGKKIYFCSWNDQNGGTATNYAIVEGTGSNCATSTAAFPGLSGGTTAATGWNTGANGGRVLTLGGYSVAQEATNADDVCIFVSAANQVNIGYKYVVQ